MEKIGEIMMNSRGEPYCMIGDYCYSMERDRDDEQEYKEIAARELRVTPDVVRDALRRLRQLLREEPELNVPIDEDDFLIKFLRPCKFYADSTFQRIKKYYDFQLKQPQYCRELVPSKVHKPFELGVISILSPRDYHGRRCMLIEAGEAWDYREVPVKELFRGIQLALEAAIAEPRTQVCGVVIIVDMKGLSFGQVMQFTPMFANMAAEFIQDCIPMRLKGVHMINQPYIFNMLFGLFKPFLRDKLRSRIHFHGTNRKSLLAHVNPEALRSRHGGTMPDPEIPGSVMCEMLMHYEDEFHKANMYGYPEKTNK